MSDKSLSEKLQLEITDKLQSAFEFIIDEKNKFYQENPKSIPNSIEISSRIREVALENSAISCGANLIPGPWGMLAVVPELILVTKNQIELIYDIAAAHGQKNILTKELAATIFLSGLGTSTGSLLTVHSDGF